MKIKNNAQVGNMPEKTNVQYVDQEKFKNVKEEVFKEYKQNLQNLSKK